MNGKQIYKITVSYTVSYVPVWLSGRALRQQRKRLWVRFPGNTHTDEKFIACVQL